MNYLRPPSSPFSIRSPPTPCSEVCSVVSILPDTNATTVTLLAARKRLSASISVKVPASRASSRPSTPVKKTINNSGENSSERPSTGGGDQSANITTVAVKKAVKINKTKPLPAIRDLLCRTKSPAERPATALYKVLSQEARHILRGRFYPKGYVPNAPPSEPTNELTVAIRRAR